MRRSFNISEFSIRSIIRGGEYEHLLQLVTINEDELIGTLGNQQKETFQKFKEAICELNDMNELTSFTLGFKLGMRLAVEAMINI